MKHTGIGNKIMLIAHAQQEFPLELRKIAYICLYKRKMIAGKIAAKYSVGDFLRKYYDIPKIYCNSRYNNRYL